jgi:hypothetical protein
MQQGPDESRLWDQWYEQAIKELDLSDDDAADYADLRLRKYIQRQQDHEYFDELDLDPEDL